MCGIVGYVGRDRRAMDVLLDGLGRLEYRGYDSAGVAIFDEGEIEVRRALGKLANLQGILRDRPLAGNIGIGHTRWATHGKPSERNAHPHSAGSVAIVHNGIIENYRELRKELEAAGRSMSSDTDTELIAHLIDLEMERGKDLINAVREACGRLVGSYAFGALCRSTPDHLVAAKNGGSPIILGLGEKESFLASDIPAILPYTRQMLFLEDGEFAVLSEDGVQVIAGDGSPVDREPKPIHWDPVSAEKGGYDRFMQKEIFEQPRAIMDTIGTRISEAAGDVDLNGIDLSAESLAGIERLCLVACGTAYYSCMVGKYLYEQIARIPVEVDLASEFRYREPILDSSVLVVPVSQSGETADTLAALRQAKEEGARVLSICNVRDASIALLAVKLGIARGSLSADEARKHITGLQRLPRLVEHVLALDQQIHAVAQKFFHATNFLFLGRGIMYPIALEGALKLKEISYIHAEGYAAGEMKHGPIALIDEDMPVVDKVISNLEQVRTRDGVVIAIATEGDREIEDKADQVIHIPDLGDHLTAVLATIPLQLLAYHVAVLKGTDVDQPRNLAKSVTVE
jgi:glucosamine--fructose-6-phosphate aminotransferase (isomerizing)